MSNLKALYYGPYIPDSTSAQRGLGKIGSQCMGCRTDGTSEAMGRGVAKSHDWLRAIY